MGRFYAKVLILIFEVNFSFCANILIVIPTPSLSHHAPFQPLWKELSLRGHKVTVLTTHPLDDPSLTNLTEINLSFSIGTLENWRVLEKIIQGIDLKETIRIMKNITNEVTIQQFEDETVQKLLHSNQHFDVLLLEVHLPPVLGFAWRFKCPWIGISSLDIPLHFQSIMGNPVHPVFNPDYNFVVASPTGLDFIERFLSLMYNFAWNIIIENYLDELSVSVRKYFGDDMPNLRKVQNNISMMLTTIHPMTHDIRALQPNTIHIGTGLHFRKPQELPKVSLFSVLLINIFKIR